MTHRTRGHGHWHPSGRRLLSYAQSHIAGPRSPTRPPCAACRTLSNAPPRARITSTRDQGTSPRTARATGARRLLPRAHVHTTDHTQATRSRHARSRSVADTGTATESASLCTTRSRNRSQFRPSTATGTLRKNNLKHRILLFLDLLILMSAC